MAWVLAARRARQVGLDRGVVRNIMRLSAGFGLLGARVVHLVVEHPEELARDPWSILKLQSGMSSLGGLVFAVLAVAVYVRRKRIPFLPYADVLVFGFFPGVFVARLGCATAHDHPGRLTD